MPDQKRTISIFIETGNAQKAYDLLLKKEKELKEAFDKATDPKQAAALKLQLDKLAEPLDRAGKKARGELLPAFNDIKKTVDDLGRRLRKMSTEDADYSKVLAQYKQANIELAEQKQKIGAIQQEQGKLSGFANSFFGNLAANAFSKGASLIEDFFSTSTEEALQAEETTARFKATLDNLGRSDAFERLTKKAQQVAKEFTYLDNDDVVGVFNKLIDYGKLTEKQMNDLLPVIIDFAAKQRISLEESTDVITKSLEGNGKALKTYGINLSEASTPAERLNIVMTELKDKVNGAAAAFSDTNAGKIASAKQQYKDLAEELGNELLPALNKLIDFTVKAIKGLPILATNIGNTFSDAFTFFTKGPAAAASQKAARDINLQQKLLNEEISREDVIVANQYFDRRKKLADDLINKEKTLADKDKKRLEIIENQKKLLAEGKIKLKAEQIAAEQLIVALDKNTLGTGDLNYDPEKAKEAERKRKADQKKILDDHQKFLEELRKLNLDYGLLNESDFEKETTAAIEKYNALRLLAHGNAEELKKIEESMREALFQIQIKYAKKELDAQSQLDEQQRKQREKFLQDQMQKGLQFLNRLGSEVLGNGAKGQKAILDEDQLNVLQNRGKKRRDAQIKQLNDEEEIAKNAAIAKGESIDLIEEQFRQKREEVEKQFAKNTFDTWMAAAQQAVALLDVFDKAKTDKENAELARDQKTNDRKKANLDKRLKAGILSQAEYDRQAAELDKKQEQKQHEIAVRQFKRQQRMQIAQALMSGAQAVASTIAALPGPFDIATLGIARAIQIGLMIATTAAQVASIASQKPPEFAHGGQVLDGPSHKDGGIHVVAEGGEAFVNKKTMQEKRSYQVTGTPSSIISWLNGLHGVSWDSSAIGKPAWSTTAPQAMNYSGVNSSIDTRRTFFATGGIVDQKPAGSAGTTLSLPPEFFQLMVRVNSTLEEVQSTLSSIQEHGVNSVISLSRLNDQQKRLDDIQSDATMK